jgi:hypothetical protein
MFFVIRKPSTMEDEGRYFLEYHNSDKVLCAAYIAQQDRETNGYYRGCFVIAESK